MVIQKNAEFFKSMSTPTVSKTFPNSQSDVLSIQIDGNFTGVIHVEGRNHRDGTWVSLAGIDLSDFSAVRGGFTKPGMYELGIVGIREIRGRIESVSGDVSMFGQIISTEEA